MEMFGLLASGAIYDWPIISQISWLLGQVMNAIYNVMDAIGINNIGVCIIIFTIIVYTLLMPLTIKQQKFSKMQSVMSPEMKKIQKKYEGKKDQASMLKQQEEMNNLYEKYGVKMSSGCLPSLFQLIFLFGLYPVVQNIPRYVTQVREVYMPLIDKIQSISGYEGTMEEIAGALNLPTSAYDFTNAGSMAEFFYRFQSSTWETLTDKMPQVESLVKSTVNEVSQFNNFLGIDIGEHPWNLLTGAIGAASVVGIILAVLIPVLAGVTQFISVKLSQSASGSALDSDNPMANSMKTMTYTMPLISVFFGFSFPAGLGLYWIASAVVRSVQQIIVNRYLKKKSVDDIIEENRKKAQKKREKKGAPAKEINKMATTSTRNAGITQKAKITDSEKEEKLRKAQEASERAKPGSLTAKANLVNRYNSGQKTQLPSEESEAPKKGRDKKKK